MATLDKEDIEALAACLAGSSEHKEHQEHHIFIAEWIEREQRKRERWERITTQVGGWAIISILGAAGTLAWHAAQNAKEWLK